MSRSNKGPHGGKESATDKILLSEFSRLCSEMKKVSKRKLQWLSLIAAGKLTCPVSGLKVHHVRLNKVPKKRGFSYHWDFYSECGEFFTVDHIHPKSKGGSVMDISNLQPMLWQHNAEKGNKLTTNET